MLPRIATDGEPESQCIADSLGNDPVQRELNLSRWSSGAIEGCCVNQLRLHSYPFARGFFGQIGNRCRKAKVIERQRPKVDRYVAKLAGEST